MPIIKNGYTYYRTAEICRMIDISKNTLFKWLKEGKLNNSEQRDWRGWRLFSVVQIQELKAITGSKQPPYVFKWSREHNN